MMPLALVTAAAMLVGWFPLSTLWHQQAQLNAASAQINVIKDQERRLALQAQAIDSKSAAALLAREQYQLVFRGQSLIQVLPGNGTGTVTQGTGDPGLQPLVSPSSVSTLQSGQPSTTSSTHGSSPRGFVERVVRTFEFWR